MGDGACFGMDGGRGLCLSDGSAFVVLPFPEGLLFRMRRHGLRSKDSRYWGFVPEEYIVGVVDRVVESRHPVTGRERRERCGLNLTNNE